MVKAKSLSNTGGSCHRLIWCLFFTTAWVFLNGCASTKQFVPFPDQAKKIEDPGMGRIYLMRPTSFGFAVPMKVFDNGHLIGETSGKGYLSWEREPGEADLTSFAENNSELKLRVNKGETHYVQQHVMVGVWQAQNYLEALNPEQGEQMLKECKPPKIMNAEGNKKRDEKYRSLQQSDVNAVNPGGSVTSQPVPT